MKTFIIRVIMTPQYRKWLHLAKLMAKLHLAKQMAKQLNTYLNLKIKNNLKIIKIQQKSAKECSSEELIR